MAAAGQDRAEEVVVVRMVAVAAPAPVVAAEAEAEAVAVAVVAEVPALAEAVEEVAVLPLQTRPAAAAPTCRRLANNASFPTRS